MADVDDPFGIVAEIEDRIERQLRAREEWSAAQAFKNAMVFGSPVITKCEARAGKELDMTEKGRREYALQKAIDVVGSERSASPAPAPVHRILQIASRFEAWLRSGENILQSAPPRGEYLDVGDRLERFISETDKRLTALERRVRKG